MAEGEVTGHAHAIVDSAAVMYRDDVLLMEWIVADTPVEVTHEEHDTILLPSGVWRVVHQRQYVRGQVRRVLD